MKQVYVIPFLILFGYSSYSQLSTAGFDSVVLQPLHGDTIQTLLSKKQKLTELWSSTYEIDGAYYHNYAMQYEYGTLHFNSKTGVWPALQLRKEKRETVCAEQFTSGGNIGRGIVAVFLPRFMSVQGEKEIAWRYNAFLQSGTEQLALHCYLKGETVKETRMGKNSAGSNMPRTKTTTYLQYRRGSAGYVLQGRDTLSEWYGSIEPKTDSGMLACATAVLSARPDKLKHKIGMFVYTQAMYGIKGNWQNQPFVILFNDMDNKVWVFWHDHLTAVFQYPGRAMRRAENMLNAPEDQEPFVTYLLVGPDVNDPEKKNRLMLQVALSAWMIDVMARPS